VVERGPGPDLHGRHRLAGTGRVYWPGIAIVSRTELLLVVLGGLFVVETLSVIIQVAVFKTRRKRVFKIAPIHHHFELLGWAETTVIVRSGSSPGSPSPSGSACSTPSSSRTGCRMSTSSRRPTRAVLRPARRGGTGSRR
jgi:hypothetical protein